MNTVSIAERRDTITPSTPATVRPVRRVGLADRLALRLGIALITWSRRPLTLESRERRATRVEQQLARLAREQAAERSLRLIAPPR